MWEGTDWEEYNKSEKNHLLWTYTSVYEATIEELKNLKKRKEQRIYQNYPRLFSNIHGRSG